MIGPHTHARARSPIKGVEVAQLGIIQRMHADPCHAALIEFLQQCPQVYRN